jgi:pseudouridine-5'-phosphate glycosidase
VIRPLTIIPFGHSENNILGKESTPFLLKRVNELTGGNSLKSSKLLSWPHFL